jgi:hypothetical protein
MPLFGEHSPCPNCGKKVKKPKSPDDYLCPHCGQPGPWATAEDVDRWNAQRSARARYESVLQSFDGSNMAFQEIAQLVPHTGMSDLEVFQSHVQAAISAANRAIGDQILTPEENTELSKIMGLLGVSWDDVRADDPMLPTKAFVSAINGGIMPEVAEPHVLPKKGEIVHFEIAANLMKEVALKEYRGGYSGFSIPIGKTGARYRVGGVRGRMVQVGTQLQVADTGLLAITNKRAVYMGSRKTLDMPLAKLVNLNVFTDGVQFQMSNRVNPPLFQTDQSEIVAALVNAAAQRLE